MADGDSTNISEVLGSISDTVLKPVGKELNEMGKVVAQSVGGSNDPQEEARKQQEEVEKKSKDAQEAAKLRQWFATVAEQEQKGRQAAAQRDQEYAARQQADEQQVKATEVKADQKEEEMNIAVQNAKTSAETRKGVGG